MRLLTSLIAATLLVAGVAVFTSHATVANAQATAAPSAAASPAASAAAAPAVIDTKDFAFVPATLTVAVGTKVTFKNSDSTAHTVTATDKSFDSANMDTGTTWTHVFDKAGTYKFICTYHPYMKGTVIVK